MYSSKSGPGRSEAAVSIGDNTGSEKEIHPDATQQIDSRVDTNSFKFFVVSLWFSCYRSEPGVLRVGIWLHHTDGTSLMGGGFMISGRGFGVAGHVDSGRRHDRATKAGGDEVVWRQLRPSTGPTRIKGGGLSRLNRQPDSITTT